MEVGDYHKGKNCEKLAKKFTISPAMIKQNWSFSNYLKKFSTERDRDQSIEYFCSRRILDNPDLTVSLLPRTEVSRHCSA